MGPLIGKIVVDVARALGKAVVAGVGFQLAALASSHMQKKFGPADKKQSEADKKAELEADVERVKAENEKLKAEIQALKDERARPAGN